MASQVWRYPLTRFFESCAPNSISHLSPGFYPMTLHSILLFRSVYVELRLGPLHRSWNHHRTSNVEMWKGIRGISQVGAVGGGVHKPGVPESSCSYRTNSCYAITISVSFSVCVRTHVHVRITCGSQFSSSYHVCPGDGAQVTRINSKCFNFISLAQASFIFKSCICLCMLWHECDTSPKSSRVKDLVVPQ